MSSSKSLLEELYYQHVSHAMTLTERLTAILSSVPDAVEEYGKQEPRRVGGAASWGDWYVKRSVAEAALAALVDKFAKRIAELEAALAERERMLRLAKSWADQIAACDHHSWSGTGEGVGVMKVWRCDNCGFVFREVWEPEIGLRYIETAQTQAEWLADLRARAAEEEK